MLISYYGDNASYNLILDANSSEYLQYMTLEKSAPTSTGAGNWLYWNTDSISAGAWYGYPTATWLPVASVNIGGVGATAISVTGDWSAIPEDTKVVLAGIKEDSRWNTTWTVGNAAPYEAFETGETAIAMDESSIGFTQPADYTKASAFAQYGTLTDAASQFNWSSTVRGNQTVRKKTNTMKCDRFIYEITGKDHRDAKLGAVGIVYKVLPTAF